MVTCVCVCIYVRTQDYACTHTNTYTYMQIQQVRAHACVHCKTLQNFAMHNKYHHGGIMLYTLRRIALHSCIHTSIHTYIYTLLACITLSNIIQFTEPNITIHVSTTHCSPLHECISLSPLGRSVCSRPMKMPPAALQCKPIACNCLKILAYL